jgi:hypothetical protein
MRISDAKAAMATLEFTIIKKKINQKDMRGVSNVEAEPAELYAQISTILDLMLENKGQNNCFFAHSTHQGGEMS